jgi:type VII secretion protein EccB
VARPAPVDRPRPSGPRPLEPPATRDQVDAYRFGLRRLEAALVRGDPVPLHEPIRTQRRAVAAGTLLGLLGMAAALAVAVVVPRPDWRAQHLVVGRPSGAVYVVGRDPDRLVPVANAVAGRLVLAALRPGDGGVSAPVLVDDELLADAPRTAVAAIPGAVAADPGRSQPPRWAVCDEVAPRPAGTRLLGTTVLGGIATGDTDDTEGVLLSAGGGIWLATGGRRHRVDSADPAVRTALGIAGHVPRPASPALLAALPEGAPLAAPSVPGAGARGPAGIGSRVGDVLVVRPAGSAPRYHVVLIRGLQEIPPLAADVLAATSERVVTEVGTDVIADLAPVRGLDLAEWPVAAPRLRGPAEAPAVCWTWSSESGADSHGGLHLGRDPSADLSLPVTGADGGGGAVDAVVVGAGGAVRTSRAAGAGGLWLISSVGVAHPVPDERSAAALGIRAATPVPEVVLRLLPGGPPLDLAAAEHAVALPTGI